MAKNNRAGYNQLMNIGCHVSIAKGIEKSPELAGGWGCEAMQIFTRSPSGGAFSPIAEETAKLFKENCKRFGIKNVYVHTPYFINLASKSNRIYYGSVSSIRKELERASELGAKYVMTHLGSAKDLGEEESVKKITLGLEKIFEGYDGSAQLLIENSAGSGMIIGSDFKQIGKILKPTYDVGSLNRHRKSVLAGICLDTQHSFASGYDWRNNFEENLNKIDSAVGLENIKLIHTNDSLSELESRIDRHASIGQGKIGAAAFEKFVALAQKNDIDMICETAYPEVIEDIKFLKEMKKNNAK